MRVKSLFIATSVFTCVLHLTARHAQGNEALDQSIIETSILVNLKSIAQAGSPSNSKQRRLSSDFSPIAASTSQSIQTDVNSSVLDSNSSKIDFGPKLSSSTPIPVDTAFRDSLTNVFDSMPAASLPDGVDYAIDYLAGNKLTLGLNDESLLLAVKSVYAAFLQSSVNANQDLSKTISSIPSRTLQNIIPDKILIWDQAAPKWTQLLSQALVESIRESNYSGDKNSLIGIASQSTISSVLALMNNSTVQANGFYPGIETVDPTRNTPSVTMKFDGSLQKFKNFDPAKTQILEFAARGLADGMFLNATLDKNNIPAFSKVLGEGSITGAMEFLSTLGGDHSQFAYEISKSIASGLSLSAVHASTSQPIYVTDNLPTLTAQEIARSVSRESIKRSLILGNGYSLNRLAESTAFGSSMGAQLASVSDKSWEFKNDWASYSRHLLAEASSTGSSQGSLNGSIGYTAVQADVDATRAATVGEFVKFIENDPTIADTTFKTTRTEILGIANGAATGSLLGNTAFAIYYPTQLEPVINYSAQGANKGGVLASNLSQVDKPAGVTEQFEVEIARALAHGAAMGAIFQVVGLKQDAQPDKRTYDVDTITALQAVTYGATFGAITGGVLAGEDAIVIKQAVKQGSNEGATAGAALGLGVAEQYADTLSIKSQASMKTAVRDANEKAAADANSNMAIKAVQASSRDMLQLMKLYNISPRFTNPSGIFSNPNRKAQDNQLFKETFPVASPI